MKIITIGDLHGKDCWKEAIKKKADTYIFVGDYVDSFTLSDKTIYNNLAEIMEFKTANRKNVVLLLGNHDVHYMYYPQYRCTGFRSSMQHDLTELFRNNQKLFSVAFQSDKFLFTHAGVSKKWLAFFEKETRRAKIGHTANIVETFNAINGTASRNVLYTVGIPRGGFLTGGIMWADVTETSDDFIEGYHQVVGHTPVPRILTSEKGTSSITYIDCLDSKTEFLEIEI